MALLQEQEGKCDKGLKQDRASLSRARLDHTARGVLPGGRRPRGEREALNSKRQGDVAVEMVLIVR